MSEVPEGRLSDLFDTIVNRLEDATADMKAAIKCIQAYKQDPAGAQSCIIEYLNTGEVAQPRPR
jgi:hypothetical protein